MMETKSIPMRPTKTLIYHSESSSAGLSGAAGMGTEPMGRSTFRGGAQKRSIPSFTQLDFHRALHPRLEKLATDVASPHLLFAGPQGSGKKTLIHALLLARFGRSIERQQTEEHEFRLPGQAASHPVVIDLTSSRHHLEFRPGQAGRRGQADLRLIQHLIDTVHAQTPSPWATNHAATGMTTDKRMGKSGSVDKKSRIHVRVLVLHGVDTLSLPAQASLRRVMEHSVPFCRLILTTSRLSRIHAAIQSRCTLIRVPLPSNQELFDLLTSENQRSGNGLLTPDWIGTIVHASQRHFVMAKTLAQMSNLMIRVHGIEHARLPIPSWTLLLEQIAIALVTCPCLSSFERMRRQLVDLFHTTATQTPPQILPPILVLTTLTRLLCARVDNTTQLLTVLCAAYSGHELVVRGVPPLIAIESFLATVLALYSNRPSPERLKDS